MTIGKATVAIDCYRGCKECAQLIGIDVRVFDHKGVEQWLNGDTGQTIEPNEYGGPNGQIAACHELFSITDLASAAEEIIDVETVIAYENVQNYFMDYGMQIIQKAIAKCDKRKHNAM